MAEPRTVKLRKPFQVGSQTVEELTFRAPTARDFRKLPLLDGYELDTVLILAGRLSGQPDVVIDKLEGEDLEEVFDVVRGFMPGFQRTGDTPSPS